MSTRPENNASPHEGYICSMKPAVLTFFHTTVTTLTELSVLSSTWLTLEEWKTRTDAAFCSVPVEVVKWSTHLVFSALILFLPNNPTAIMWNRWSRTHLSFMSFFPQCRDSVLMSSAGKPTDFYTKNSTAGTCTSTSHCIPGGGIQSVPAAVWPDQAPGGYTALIFLLGSSNQKKNKTKKKQWFYPVSLKINVVDELSLLSQLARIEYWQST